MAHVHQCVSAAIAVLFLLMGPTTVQARQQYPLSSSSSFRPLATGGIVTPSFDAIPSSFKQWHGRRLANETIDTGNFSSNNGGHRGQCSICVDVPLRPDAVSPYEGGNLTCLDFETFASNLDAESSNCTEIQNLVPYCCEVTLHECETNVRSKLFRSAKYYDRGVAPSPPNYGRSIDVQVWLVYYGITDLNLKAGTTEIFVNLGLQWKDSRLAWTVNASDTCADSITTKASMDASEETSEIWVPDFNLLNKVLGTAAMPDARAEVTNDGTVTWSRDGPLKALCSFTGLSRIPFDTIGCKFLMGGGETNIGRTKYMLWNNTNEEKDTDGIFIGYEDTPNYVTYTLDRTLVKTTLESDGSPIEYDFYFTRATSYYVLKVIVPNIVFTVLSFGVFLLDMRVGERLSYGVAVLLVNVAQDIVTQELLPVSDELLWIDVLISGSFYWILIGVLESVFVGWLYFLRYDKRNNGDRIASAAAESDRHGESSEKGDVSSHASSRYDKHNNDDRIASVAVESDRHDESSEKGDVSSHASSRHFSEDSDDDEGVERGQPHWSPQENEISKETLQTQDVPRLRRRGLNRSSVFTLSQALRTSRSTQVKFIRKIDRFCFIVIPSSYFLFLVIMFTTNDNWGNDRFTYYTGGHPAFA